MKQYAQPILYTCSFLLTAVYLFSLLSPYIHPSKFWPFTFLALVFPMLAISMAVLAISWLFFNRKISLLILILLFVGYKNLSAVFAINMPHAFINKKAVKDLRIISWNVRGFGNNARHAESPDSVRRKMIDFLKETNADILLLQEFVNYNNKSDYSNIQMLHDSLGYSYYHTSHLIFTSRSSLSYESGSAIFSRLPLFDTASLYFSDLSVPESAVSAEVVYANRKIRLVTSHLVSMNLKKGTLDRTDDNFKKYDSAFIYNASTFTKLKHYDSLHSNQALQLQSLIKKAINPVLVSGDFNSIPSSYTYHTIRGNLQDAFLEKGFGIGRTYTGLSPTLRIDYIFLDERFTVVQYSCPQLYLSDHFPLITDVRWH